jgi:hypothetical protein
MPTTQTNKRRAAATKRSTTAKKAAGTRARKSTATNARRAKTNVKRRVSQPQTNARGVRAQVEVVGAVANNVVQTGVTAGFKLASGITRRVADRF